MPRLSLVLVTCNDEAFVGACLAALGRQRADGFEVLVVDAGSTDRTVEVVRKHRAALPFPLRLLARRSMPLHLALDIGVALARAPLVVLVRPDAAPGPDWVEKAFATLTASDLAFRPAGPRAPRRPSTRPAPIAARRPVAPRRRIRPRNQAFARLPSQAELQAHPRRHPDDSSEGTWRPLPVANE